MKRSTGVERTLAVDERTLSAAVTGALEALYVHESILHFVLMSGGTPTEDLLADVDRERSRLRLATRALSKFHEPPR